MTSRSTLFLAACALLLAGCSGGEDAPPPAPERGGPPGALPLTDDQIARLDIAFAAAAAATEVPVADVPATIAPPPNARVAVAATIPGVVTRTLVVEGDRVAAGQPLAIVASREVLAMQSALEKAEARAGVSRSAARRLDQLAGEGVIAGARADEAAAALREAQADLGEQRRTLALVSAGRRGGSYTLTAPIAGTVTTASAQTGMPVDESRAPYVIDAAGRYEVTAQLPERLIGEVRPGMTILCDGTPGRITSVGTTVDASTRSAIVRATIPPRPGLVGGRATTATLLKPAPPGAVEVPSAAVVMIEDRAVVFVRTAGGIVRRRVTSAGTAGDRTVLLSGVKAGERVAVSGTSELKALVN